LSSQAADLQSCHCSGSIRSSCGKRHSAACAKQATRFKSMRSLAIFVLCFLVRASGRSKFNMTHYTCPIRSADTDAQDRLGVSIGRLLCSFNFTSTDGMPHAAAYVRWYTETQPDGAAASSLRLVRLGWAHFGASSRPHYGVVELERIVCPVLLQQAQGQLMVAKPFRGTTQPVSGTAHVACNSEKEHTTAAAAVDI